jgi:hypothetical protein
MESMLLLHRPTSKHTTIFLSLFSVLTSSHRVLLQCFCGLEIFVLTSWGNADTDVYVPVIENLEAAMIAARNAMLDKGWSPDPKCYDERRFAARRRPPAGTKCHAHSAKEEEGVSESETEGTTPNGEDEPLPRQKVLLIWLCTWSLWQCSLNYSTTLPTSIRQSS